MRKLILLCSGAAVLMSSGCVQQALEIAEPIIRTIAGDFTPNGLSSLTLPGLNGLFGV